MRPKLGLCAPYWLPIHQLDAARQPGCQPFSQIFSPLLNECIPAATCVRPREGEGPARRADEGARRRNRSSRSRTALELHQAEARGQQRESVDVVVVDFVGGWTGGDVKLDLDSQVRYEVQIAEVGSLW